MSDEAKKAANAKIAELLNTIKDATDEAVALADAHGLDFSFPEPAYGMGGNYYGLGNKYRREADRWGDPSDGWAASSQSC